jgi:hypothetical protein
MEDKVELSLMAIHYSSNIYLMETGGRVMTMLKTMVPISHLRDRLDLRTLLDEVRRLKKELTRPEYQIVAVVISEAEEEVIVEGVVEIVDEAEAVSKIAETMLATPNRPKVVQIVVMEHHNKAQHHHIPSAQEQHCLNHPPCQTKITSTDRNHKINTRLNN